MDGQVLGAENPTGHWEPFHTSPRIIYVRCLLYVAKKALQACCQYMPCCSDRPTCCISHQWRSSRGCMAAICSQAGQVHPYA